jgi:hypothetical protein
LSDTKGSAVKEAHLILMLEQASRVSSEGLMPILSLPDDVFKEYGGNWGLSV